MRYLLIILAFASCTTQRKAVDYFNTHTKEAAQYCAVTFPPRDSIIVRVDTLQVEADVTELMNYADSLTRALYKAGDIVDSARGGIAAAIKAKDFSEQRFITANEQLKKYKAPDTVALSRAIEAKIRATLKPCKDSIIYRENTAKAAYYAIMEAEYNKIKEDKKMPGIVFLWLLGALARQWWFWLIVAGLIAWAVWRIRAGALNSILSKFK